MTFKQKIYADCLQLINEKIRSLREALHDLKTGAENDAKSSAGDKHETSRAMMQLEYEKINRQLDELLRQKNGLEKIDIGQVSPKIINGSLIKTNNGYLFLSVAIGKITVDDKIVMVVSSQSPVGLKILGKKTGDTVEVNKIKYLIEEIK
ncbi:MAG: hypothetical protein ABIT08_10335 [Bacteroidia bacterium]